MASTTGDSNRLKAATSASSKDMGDGNLPYSAFFLILIVYTAFEVLIFLKRDAWSIANNVLVPLLLALTLLKFILVIGWFLYNGRETNWVRKVLLVSLVTAGASGLIMHLLI
jgi:hypothetical protein